MSGAVIQSTITKLYKTIYPPGQDLSNFSKRKTPLGDRIRKVDSLYGANLTFPINFGLGHGVASSLTASIPDARTTHFDNWVYPCDTGTYPLYARITHDTPTIMRAKKDVGTFMRANTKSIQEHLDNMKMIRCGQQIWSDGAGNLAQVASVTGSDPVTTITLTNVSDSVKFTGDGNQYIVFNATRTGSSGGIRASVYKVAGVNRLTSSGTCILTVTRVSGAGAADPVANDYIYLYNTYDGGFLGIPSWIPSSDPTATTFYGVDRTKEMQMLSGWRGQWEGSISRSAAKLAHYMNAFIDPNTSALWLHPYRWWQLSEELKGEKMFMLDDARSLEWGTQVLKMVTPAGMVPVASDEYCPTDAGFLLNHDSWEIMTTGPLIHAADEDVSGLRLADADGLEYRFRSLAGFRCDNPGKNGRFPISQAV